MFLRKFLPVALSTILLAACTGLGPQGLEQTRLSYNESTKRTAEEQLLLNIVRLRYMETPSSLAVSAIAAQFERTQSASLMPFFAATGGDVARSSFVAVLPQAQWQNADRPTISFTPQDDQEFTRKLFTPLPLDGVIYLAKTTWPISTVFRLYLENLNWVPNAQTASGPTPRMAPQGEEFLQGIRMMQKLQDSAQIFFGSEEHEEILGGPLSSDRISGSDVLEAAKQGMSYRLDDAAGGWVLVRTYSRPVLQISPTILDTPEIAELSRIFHLQRGLTKYYITQESLDPFSRKLAFGGVDRLDLETRSLLQALFYASHGVDIPDEHAAMGVVRVTRDANGKTFDWERFMHGFFRVRQEKSDRRPPIAQVAVRFRDHWFYISDDDTDTKATFSLLLELARLELAGKTGPGPQLTLPLSR